MKQKVVIKLSVHDERARAKAMKTAVGVDGVNSASYQQDKNQMEVMGEGIDVVLLTTSLRKRKSLKYAEVVSVSPVEEKKKEEKKEEKKSEPAELQYFMGYPQYVVTYPSYEETPNICTIL